MKLYTVAVQDVMMCIKEDNYGPKKNSNRESWDNYVWGMGVSNVIWLTVLVQQK